MKKAYLNNQDCFIFPKISKYYQLLHFFFKRAGVKVFYRGSFNGELKREEPSDIFFKATEAYGRFLNAVVDADSVQRIAKRFHLKPEILAKVAKELLFKKIQFDFYYVYQVSKRGNKGKIGVIYPFSNHDKRVLNGYLGVEGQLGLIDIFSSMGYLLDRIKLLMIGLIRTFQAGYLLINWRVSSISSFGKSIKRNYIWIASGLSEISMDPGKLSLPLYLKQVSEQGDFKGKRFAVICSFLKKGQGWDHSSSFSIPKIESIKPGLSNPLFLKGMEVLFQAFVHLLFSFFKKGRSLDILTLIPQVILNQTWLQSLGIEAVFITESCAGAASPVVHAAREIGIPVIMVCYAANHRAVVLEKQNQNIVPVLFQNLLAEYICVWTSEMKEWLVSAGYDQNKIFVVGPQMFAPVLIYDQVERKDTDKISIALFDITPMTDEVNVRLGRGEYVFDVDYMLSFRKQAFNVVRKVFGDNFCILSKMKRKIHQNNKRMVVGWEDKVKEALPEFNSYLQQKDPDSNPWEVLAGGDVVISIPFTSLSEAGFAMGKPSAFFDPTRRICPHPGKNKVPLLSGEEELYQWLLKVKNKLQIKKTINYDNFGPKEIAKTLQNILSISR